MKKTAVIWVFLFCSGVAFSQPQIKFLGIDWGIPFEKVANEMQHKGYILEEYYPDKSPPHAWYSGTFSGRKATILLDFYQDSFFKAEIYLTPKISELTDYYYFLDQLTLKYGDWIQDSRYEFESPFWKDGIQGEITLAHFEQLVNINYYDSNILKKYNDKTKIENDALEMEELKDL